MKTCIIIVLLLLLLFHNLQIINIENIIINYPIQCINNINYKEYKREELLIKENVKSNEIPKILFQTYYNKLKIPNYIFEDINKYASNYKYILLDDEDAVIFLKEYYNPIVLNAFNSLKIGAHKADLLRYCLLYVYGGVYLDIKTLLQKPLDDIFSTNDFYTCLSHNKTGIHNAIIASKPNNDIFLKLISQIINYNKFIINNVQIVYHDFCKYLYKTILEDIQKNNSNITLINYGLNEGKENNYIIFNETCNDVKYECTKKDKYGLCCVILDETTGSVLFKSRDPNFPWI